MLSKDWHQCTDFVSRILKISFFVMWSVIFSRRIKNFVIRDRNMLERRVQISGKRGCMDSTAQPAYFKLIFQIGFQAQFMHITHSIWNLVVMTSYFVFIC